MPILRVARAHTGVARAMAVQRPYARWAAMARETRGDSSDFGILGEKKVPQNGRFPALDADEPPCKILCR